MVAAPRVGSRRTARLAWYGAGVAAVALCGRSAFVPAPGKLQSAPVSGLDAATAAAISAVAMMPEEAWAKGGVYGPLEGKVSSLVHPFMMAGFFLTTLYTGFLGWQWRQTRLIGVEVADLRKQLPKDMDPEAEPSAAVKSLKAQIDALTADRSELIKGQYKDKHYATSAILLGGGIFFTIYGVFNTWFRTEKLFPGPHLFAGAAIVVLWALAAACVPSMEKGDENARNVHIALNVINVGLFCWQLPTGFEIFLKVVGNANLPLF
jgi:hypothetical protein